MGDFEELAREFPLRNPTWNRFRDPAKVKQAKREKARWLHTNTEQRPEFFGGTAYLRREARSADEEASMTLQNLEPG